MKNLVSKRILGGVFSLLTGIYIAWIVIDSYYNQTLGNNQIQSMSLVATFLILMGTFYMIPKMNSVKELFTKDKISGLFTVLSGCYILWIVVDCYYEQTLESNQISSMFVISTLMILMGYYYLIRSSKTTKKEVTV